MAVCNYLSIALPTAVHYNISWIKVGYGSRTGSKSSSCSKRELPLLNMRDLRIIKIPAFIDLL
jgi:hypothetical protein